MLIHIPNIPPAKAPKLKFKELKALFSSNKLPIVNPHVTRDLRVDWEWTETPTNDQIQLAETLAASLENFS